MVALLLRVESLLHLDFDFLLVHGHLKLLVLLLQRHVLVFYLQELILRGQQLIRQTLHFVVHLSDLAHLALNYALLV